MNYWQFNLPSAVPSPPSITTVVPYPPTPFSALQIDWLAPTMPNGIIECYLVTVCEENQPSICPIMNNNVSATPDLFYIATGLTPDTSYSVTIVAKNGAAETLQHSDPDTASGMTDHGGESLSKHMYEHKRKDCVYVIWLTWLHGQMSMFPSLGLSEVTIIILYQHTTTYNHTHSHTTMYTCSPPHYPPYSTHTVNACTNGTCYQIWQSKNFL